MNNTEQSLSKFGPDQDFIGAGDEVAIIIDGRIVATGILVDAQPDGTCIVNAESEDDPGNGWTEEYTMDQIAHIDSPQADAAAMFGEDL